MQLSSETRRAQERFRDSDAGLAFTTSHPARGRSAGEGACAGLGLVPAWRRMAMWVWCSLCRRRRWPARQWADGRLWTGPQAPLPQCVKGASSCHREGGSMKLPPRGWIHRQGSVGTVTGASEPQCNGRLLPAVLSGRCPWKGPRSLDRTQRQPKGPSRQESGVDACR